MTKTKCGYVAIVGRPNVGKSTLLNHLIGEKVSITSRKPQTTRRQILGIKTEKNTQLIYVDTPGLHRGVKKTLNRFMNRAALQAIKDVDVVIFVVDGVVWQEGDEWILRQLKKIKTPIIIAVNKVDRVQPKERLLPYLQHLATLHSFQQIMPISALKGNNLKELEQVIRELLPDNPFFFAKDQRTDQNDRFFCAEIIREKLIRQLGDELPYAATVATDIFKEEKKLLRIAATIYVEKEGQKAIVIGAKGERLKIIGMAARQELEKIFKQKIFLQLWVKVKSSWSENEKFLKSFGFG